MHRIREAMERVAGQGQQPVVLCSARIRLPLKRFAELSLPSLVVLAYNEVSSNVEVTAAETIDGGEA